MVRIGILASGGGTNAQAIIDATISGKLPARVSFLVADRPCYALERARSHKIPTALIHRKEHTSVELCKNISETLSGEVDIIVLAGFLSILDKPFIQRWEGRIINIHPSLLPKFGGKGMYGIHVHRAVLQAGEQVSGCSVHLVHLGVDTGEVLLRKEVLVLPTDTPESLQQRVLVAEHTAIVEGSLLLIQRLSSPTGNSL